MKKIVASLVLCMAVIAANAQKAVEGNKFTDNWSVGFNAGGTTPLTHSAFFQKYAGCIGSRTGQAGNSGIRFGI